jgi:Pentose-5-phosphate-3-epimerase
MGGMWKRARGGLGVDRIQLDVIGWKFRAKSYIGPEMIAACRKYCNVPFETQLMVSQYNCETMLESYVKATKRGKW